MGVWLAGSSFPGQLELATWLLQGAWANLMGQPYGWLPKATWVSQPFPKTQIDCGEPSFSFSLG